MHCVLETENYANQAENVGLTEDERHRVHTLVSDDPKLGDLIPGTGGARKFRFPKRGMGKRSGFRVITYFAADDVPVFLLDILDKGERVNLTQAEKNEFKKELGRIADDYRKSVAEKVATLELAS